MLELRLLGPPEVLIDGASLPLGTPKQQAVLAVLALRADAVVGVSELVDELWPARPPASSVANARGYAANLRRTFEHAAPGSELLTRRGAGYQLLARPEDVDLTMFLAEAQHAVEAWRQHDLDSTPPWSRTASPWNWRPRSDNHMNRGGRSRRSVTSCTTTIRRRLAGTGSGPWPSSPRWTSLSASTCGAESSPSPTTSPVDHEARSGTTRYSLRAS